MAQAKVPLVTALWMLCGHRVDPPADQELHPSATEHVSQGFQGYGFHLSTNHCDIIREMCGSINNMCVFPSNWGPLTA